MDNTKFLECFSESELYFVPFSVDGNWHEIKDINVLIKKDLIGFLSCNCDWAYKIFKAECEEDIFYITIELSSKKVIEALSERVCASNKIHSYIEIYLPYKDILNMYKGGVESLIKWDRIIKKEDL